MSKLTISEREGMWDELDVAEDNASRILHDILYDYGAIFRTCHALGVQVTVLPEAAAVRSKLWLRVAALFLRRVLNDLRSSWILVSRGYTSQAACVAASLWENSLVISCVVGNEDRAERCLSSDDGEIPWRPRQLAKMHGRACRTAKTDEERTTQELLIYSNYHWLCRIKHPTLPSATHDAFGAGFGPKGDYAILALPNVRPEDLAVKVWILTIIGLHTVHAIESFSEELKIGEHPSSEWLDLKFQLSLVANGIVLLLQTYVRCGGKELPFKFSRKFRKDANSLLKNSHFCG